ncbi:MAG: hypothetical protein ACXWE0_08500 [Nitrososphaeraceae archaeon]
MTEIICEKPLLTIDCYYYVEKTYEERLELLKIIYTKEKDSGFNSICNLFYYYKYRGQLKVMLPSVESGLQESLNFDDYILIEKTTGS